jgi:hypothetical protein
MRVFQHYSKGFRENPPNERDRADGALRLCLSLLRCPARLTSLTQSVRRKTVAPPVQDGTLLSRVLESVRIG